MINKANSFFMGIDIGSATTKAVIIDKNKEILFQKIIDTDPNHKRSVDKILGYVCGKLSNLPDNKITEKDITYCIGTGYGRNNIFCADKTVTEISCHAKGVNYYFPTAKTIIDIGGQDSKVISIDDKGEVINFAMNEKCAAGTGRFLEVISEVLEVDINDIGPMSLKAEKEAKISSMCTVFAESEVITKIAEDVEKDSILKGLHSSIAFRVLALGRRIGIKFPLAFTGGVAKNTGIIWMMADQIGIGISEILIAPHPQIIGALGASLFALEEYNLKDNVTDSLYPDVNNISDKFRETIPQTHSKPDKPVIGWTDLSVPVELIMAAGLNNVRIRGDIEKGASSDQYLQTYSCAYIKNSISALMEQSEKYRYLDGIITTNCCTATEKMFDILKCDDRFQKLFIHPITVPRKNTDYAVEYMKKNILSLKKAIEQKFELKITEEKIRFAVERINQVKRLIKEYSVLLAGNNFPDAAYLVAFQMEKLWSMMDVNDEFIHNIENKIKILKSISPLERQGPNIMITGSIIPDIGFYTIFQNIKCNVVYNNTSGGNKFSESLADVEQDDIYSAIATRCLYSGYGPRMMDSDARINELKEIIDKFRIDAIVFNISKFCVNYTFEAVLLKQYCDEWNLPLLTIETDFTDDGSGQIKTRIEAFIEAL